MSDGDVEPARSDREHAATCLDGERMSDGEFELARVRATSESNFLLVVAIWSFDARARSLSAPADARASRDYQP